MQPITLDDMPNEIFLEEIHELTQEFPLEFPHLFEKIQLYLAIDKKYIYLTDFVEDENQDNHFYGYFFDSLHKKMYRYAFENNQAKFYEVDIKNLTLKHTRSLRVLHLL